MSYPPCKRCGICCAAGSCKFGKENKEDGVCIYLEKIEDDIYSCSLLTKGKIKPEDISIGDGCILRKEMFVFKHYEKLTLARLKNRFRLR